MKTIWGKRIGLLAGTIGVLVLGGFILFAPQQSFAQETCPDGTPLELGCPGEPNPGGGLPGTSPSTDTPPAESSSPGVSGFTECFVSSIATLNVPVPDINCLIGKYLYSLVWVTFGQLVFMGAMFFQGALEYTMKFSSFVSDISGIRAAWSILRDTMNIFFIFLLLYASIRMILGIGKHETIIKGIVTAGLLINFSFFFTSVIIDASNVFVVELNQAIVTIGAGKTFDGDADPESQWDRSASISAVFMQGLGIQTKAPDGVGNPKTYETHIFQQLIFSSITFLVVAFVFYAMGFLLILRFLILIILLITSPIAVMGGFFPQLSAQSKKWWDTLIGQAVFAPLMMLFLTVTAVIISSPGFKATFLLSNTTMKNPFPFGDGMAGLIQYVFVIGMLITSIVVAKQTAGGTAKGLTDWATKTAGAASFGLAAWTGRQTLGRFGSSLADDAELKRLAASDKFSDRVRARSLIGIGNYAKSSSFDFRASGVAGLDKGMVGQAQKGGYEKWYKDRQKAQEGRNKGYGAESQATSSEVEEAKLHELKMKEQYRLGKVSEQAVKNASMDREIAEDKAKIEKAQSQQGMARYAQGTLASTAGSGFGRRAGTLWTAMVSPADRAAAAELEKAAGKDQKKAEGELARHEYDRDDAVVKALQEAIGKTTEDQLEAAKEATEELNKINESIEKLVDEAKERGMWDEARKSVWNGGVGNLSGRDKDIQTEIDSLRDEEQKQKNNREVAMKAVTTAGGRSQDELKQDLQKAITQRDKNKKGLEAKEKKQREDDLKILADKIKEGDDAGKPAKPETPAAAPAAEE